MGSTRHWGGSAPTRPLSRTGHFRRSVRVPTRLQARHAHLYRTDALLRPKSPDPAHPNPPDGRRGSRDTGVAVLPHVLQSELPRVSKQKLLVLLDEEEEVRLLQGFGPEEAVGPVTLCLRHS